MNYLRHISLFVVLLSVSFLQAQEENSTLPETIDNTFTEVITQGGKYRANGKVYRVIETYKLDKLQKTTKTRIGGLLTEIDSLKKQITDQQAEALKINKALAQTQETLEATLAEKDAVTFLGQPMSKTNYKTTMWVIIAVLLLLLVLFIFRFKNSNVLTKEAQHKLAETDAEFEEYRRKALEKEQKLGRQLQDERNKILKSTKS